MLNVCVFSSSQCAYLSHAKLCKYKSCQRFHVNSFTQLQYIMIAYLQNIDILPGHCDEGFILVLQSR